MKKDSPRSRKKAVALRYRPDEDHAPVVVAKGAGVLADKILEIAEQHRIPLYEDPDLVELLSTIDRGQVIPPQLYKAVAEILVFVYRMNGKFPPNP
ncbi:MAG: EscU/YscU/HrcU family type III secretion system export apparatus switch protein [bacterium]